MDRNAGIKSAFEVRYVSVQQRSTCISMPPNRKVRNLRFLPEPAKRVYDAFARVPGAADAAVYRLRIAGTEVYAVEMKRTFVQQVQLFDAEGHRIATGRASDALGFGWDDAQV
jgi:hypothetical protein